MMASIRSYSSSSGSSQASHSSSESTDSGSTYQTSTSSTKSRKYEEKEPTRKYAPYYYPSEVDVSPSTSLQPRSSADTYSSIMSEEESHDVELEDSFSDDEGCAIPELPVYHGEPSEPYVRPSNPSDFAKLFPSCNRLSIRHDDYTSDGNLNLRVDTLVSAPGHRRLAMQLFHLRMYDLAKREFSLRRYSRDSGREVCNSKRKYQEPGTTADGRPTLQRSVSSALKTLGSRPHFGRINSHGSPLAKRPGTSSSTREAEEDEYFSRASSFDKGVINPHHRQAIAPRPVATNTIRLEFSNYARVDISRRGSSGGKGKKSSKRYEFEWWGHKYSWKRHVDKTLGTVSFHLLRDNNTSMPVAHIVPETRTPSQVRAEESAGGWVPPCHMWISDDDVLLAMTDVADVIMATGLIALVDDCIKERWQIKKKPARLAIHGRSASAILPRSFGLSLFHRRNSEQSSSPLRLGNLVSTY